MSGPEFKTKILMRCKCCKAESYSEIDHVKRDKKKSSSRSLR